ncbi:sugar transferase [Syntrophomonas erecta subsp. sporosyntropha]
MDNILRFYWPIFLPFSLPLTPRPPVTYHPYKYEDYPSNTKRRFEVLPGVTGLAQINGRNELSWDEKFKYDLEYIEKIGLVFDLKILIQTIFKVMKMEGSYDLKKKSISGTNNLSQ